MPDRDKLSEYHRLENCDLWEHRLNLTPQETERMAEHVWELQQIRFDYFFFDENCSFRLLELLEIARPGIELTRHLPLPAIPTDTVRAVKDAGLLWRNPLGNLTLEAHADYFHNGEVRRRLSLHQQWELSPRLGVRLSGSREFSQLAAPVNEVKLELELRGYHY